MGDMHEAVRWEIRVPIFKNKVILKQLGLAIGIPFGLVALVIALVSGRSRDTLYALGLMAALLILTWLFIMAAYRGKYEVEFVLDGKGVSAGRKQSRQERTGSSTLTVMLSLIPARPPPQARGGCWRNRGKKFLSGGTASQKVKYKPKSRTILLRGGWTEQIALFCTGENYEQVESFVRSECPAS